MGGKAVPSLSLYEKQCRYSRDVRGLRSGEDFRKEGEAAARKATRSAGIVLLLISAAIYVLFR